MRRISFSKTTKAIEDRTKTVTRRLGWRNLQPGERLQAVDRLRTKDARQLAVIEVVSTRWEPLRAIKQEDVDREGRPFGATTVKAFVDGFCEEMKCEPKTMVNRIEFRYVEEA